MKILQGDIVVLYVGTKEYPYDWELRLGLSVVLSNGEEMDIPAGYVTDFTSVPRYLWSFISPIGKYNLASVIHDYMYTEHNYDRKFADDEFLKWMNFFEPEHKIRNKVMYLALRIFGKARWEKYSKKDC